MFRVVFVRHGIKASANGQMDYDVPLADGEAAVARVLGRELAGYGAVPAVWLCSHFAHARQTAEALAEGVVRVVPVCGLTPYSANEGAHLDPILYELGRLQVKIDGADCIGLVGHEARLSNLANEFLPPEPRMGGLDSYLEAVCLEATSLLAFIRREAKVAFRLPRHALGTVVGRRNPADDSIDLKS
jgi:phosphohistidine phosphatase SixA